eukprot:scaffold1469_cov257-Pinguiococcus_pyrenoidosus.AAC.8
MSGSICYTHVLWHVGVRDRRTIQARSRTIGKSAWAPSNLPPRRPPKRRFLPYVASAPCCKRPRALDCKERFSGSAKGSAHCNQRSAKQHLLPFASRVGVVVNEGPLHWQGPPQ